MLEAGLPEDSLPTLLTDVAMANLGALSEIPGATTRVVEVALAGAMRSYTNAYQLLYLVSLAFGFCSIIAAVVVNSQRMNQVLTSQIVRKMHHTGHKVEESYSDQGVKVSNA